LSHLPATRRAVELDDNARRSRGRCREVFGSVARGEAGPDSDVDLLYVRVPGNDLGMAYFDLQEDLERLSWLGSRRDGRHAGNGYSNLRETGTQ